MLLRMVGKLLFKAALPLVAVAGVLTYGVYMRGGDPGALWKGALAGTVSQASTLVSGLKNDATRAAGALSMPGDVSSGAQSSSGGELTTVFTWQDAQGVTHYSSTEPVHLQASTVTVDPDVNVLAPVRAPQQARQSESDPDELDGAGQRVSTSSLAGNGESGARQHTARSGAGSQQSNADIQEVTEQLGGTLPGVAGQVLSTRGEGGGALDPSQLIRMLQ